MRHQPNGIFKRVVNIGKLPVLRRCVTAARAAIPLVKQNALSALSSFARRLNTQKSIKKKMKTFMNGEETK